MAVFLAALDVVFIQHACTSTITKGASVQVYMVKMAPLYRYKVLKMAPVNRYLNSVNMTPVYRFTV